MPTQELLDAATNVLDACKRKKLKVATAESDLHIAADQACSLSSFSCACQ